VRKCESCPAITLSLSLSSLWKDRYGRPIRIELLGFGSIPTTIRDGRRVGRSKTTSPPSAGRPFHQGTDSLCMDRIGLPTPRGRSPCHDGLSVLPGAVPVQSSWIELGRVGYRPGIADLRRLGPTWPPFGRAGRVAGRGTGAGLQAGGLCLGSPRVGVRVEAPAVVRADPLELVAPGLAPLREGPPGRGRLLALGGLESIGRVRAGVGRLGRVRPVSVLSLPGAGYIGARRVGLRCQTAWPVAFRCDSRHARRAMTHR
jgi:hypothetical protein